MIATVPRPWTWSAGAAILAALAAWLSMGSVAFATEGGPRIAVLPLSPPALVCASALGLAVLALLRTGSPFTPLWLLLLVVLPWIPVQVPAAFLVWTGPVVLIVWCSVLLLMLAPHRERAAIQGAWRHCGANRSWLTAAALSLAIAAASAWVAAPAVPGGDEPHYLVITQSLLLDRDLKIENNHQRGDYRAYYGAPLRPHFLRRGRDGEIYSIHAPGLPVLVTPAFAIGGYRAVVIVLVVLVACGGALLWHVGWIVTRNVQAAWFGWASIVLTPTWLLHTFMVYPDVPGGILALIGVLALLHADRAAPATRSRRWLLYGTALAALPWLHTRFALLAISLGTLILLRLSRTRNGWRHSMAFLTVPVISATGWFAMFAAIYGTPNPIAAYGGSRELSAAFIPGGLAGLLLDQRFGLLANAPVLACAIFGFATMLLVRSYRRLGLELLCVVIPYLLSVSSYAMWWGGWSAPARFATAILPMLVVPSAVAWTYLTRAGRVLALATLALTGFISAVLVGAERGRLAFNTRHAYARWLDWISPLADLGRGMPAWFRDSEPRFFIEIVIWVVTLGLAWLGVRIVARRQFSQRPAVLSTVSAIMLAAAVMIALTITWSLHGVAGTNAEGARRRLVSYLLNEPRVLAIAIQPPGRINHSDFTILRVSPDIRHTMRYGATSAFFLDSASYPGAEGFWVAGKSRASVVLQFDGMATTARLLLRNAPVENTVSIESGAWREDLTLAPGEERRIQIPLKSPLRLALVRFNTGAGYRPSEVDASSRDERLLGVWVKIE
jgi:hypothetical protein